MEVVNIILYGAERCSKTRYYKAYLQELGLSYQFYDVEKDELAAIELRSLYLTGKLHFPTILINGKKLRNPSKKDLLKSLKNKGILA